MTTTIKDASTQSRLHRFKSDVDHIELPKLFTFPFYYDPHELGVIAVNEVQQYLETQKDWVHNFGLVEGQEGLVIGKMFGVLVVEDSEGKLGYLTAFSGKLADNNHHDYFVPPVFDMLEKQGYYKSKEEEVNEINRQLEKAEKDPLYLAAKQHSNDEQKIGKQQIANCKSKIKEGKKRRKAERANSIDKLSKSEYETLVESLRIESIKSNYYLKDLVNYWDERWAVAKAKLSSYQAVIDELKALRKAKSNALQQWLFHQYQFLNKEQETKHLLDIFQNTTLKVPPAGAGECAAPKLFQYAFRHGLRPVTMVEFWWGESPKSEIRKHKYFYPSCRGKCEPILGHMLSGIETDPNPMLENPAYTKEIKFLYEDDYLAVIEKPGEFLSVPGRYVKESVASRMKDKFPEATGPLIVHRLDMSTTGIMLIAKSLEMHALLQRQFIKKTIKKRYIAVLDGQVNKKEEFIDLPLRVDLDDRPRQLVCYEHGKSARTRWELIEEKDGKSRVYFYPITGRTHQLRVHASHPLGLNTPIVGDDLYGQKGDRLHLHAEQITFVHPETGKEMTINSKPDF